jgi:hypothetical protein
MTEPPPWDAQGSTEPATARWKRLAWPWLVVGILLLVVVGGCGAFLVAESDWGSNDAVHDGQFEFFVTDFRKATVRTEPPPDGENFLALLSVTNTGTDPRPFVVGNQKLIDAAGHGYAARGMADLHLDHETTILEIPPGATTKLGIRFDVPIGTRLTAIELHESATSRGATIDL